MHYANLLIQFGLLVLTLNEKTVLLAIAAALIAVTYPLMKRFTHFPQVYLGAAFTWSVPMAYAAHLDTVPVVAWWLFVAGVFWVVAYDTFYAMVDRDDDLKIGIKSTAVLFGSWDRRIIGACQVLVLGLLVYIGSLLSMSFWYYLGVGAASLFAVYQQYITKDRQRDACFKAFLNNNWFGLMIFCGILLHYTFAAPAA
ncbi:MAG: 4-hydroxybenzoate octaprenyltransferase [Pseudomonadota bacterium]